MDYIKSLFNNIHTFMTAYKHTNIQDVMNDTTIENMTEKYAKAVIIGGANLCINGLMFNIECITCFCRWFIKEYQYVNVYIEKYYENYYNTNVNVVEQTLDDLTTHKKED